VNITTESMKRRQEEEEEESYIKSFHSSVAVVAIFENIILAH